MPPGYNSQVKARLLAAFLAVLAEPLSGAAVTLWDEGAGREVSVAPNRLLVGFLPGKGAVPLSLAASPLFTTADGTRVDVVELPAGDDLLARKAALEGMAGVAFVSFDHEMTLFATPDDPVFPDQWTHLPLNLPAAWDAQTGAPTALVAVFDSGFDLAHPDIAYVLPAGANLDYGSSPNDPDPTWDTFDGVGPNNCTDNPTAPYHGTAVAGLVSAAGDNAVSGVGAGWDLRVVPFKVMDDNCQIFDSYWIAALAAIRNDPVLSSAGIRVVSMSFGGESTSAAQQTAVTAAWNAGLFLVAAAGNCGRPTTNPSLNPCAPEINPPIYPAALDDMFAVTSNDESDLKSDFGEYGVWVDVAVSGGFSNLRVMPACGIGPVTWGPVTTDISGAQGYNTGGGGPGPLSEVCDPSGNMYYEFFGTSASAPLAAGVAALVLSEFPALSNAQVRDALVDTARVPAGWDPGGQGWGAGIVDAAAALGVLSWTTVVASSPALSPVNAAPLQTTVPAWRGEVAVNAGTVDVEIVSLTLTGAGSGEDDDDVVSVDLWRDDDLDGVPDGALLATGTFGADDGTVTLTPGAPIPIAQGNSAVFLVTYDFGDPSLFAAEPREAGAALLALVLVGMALRRRRGLAALLVLGLLWACGGGGGSPAPTWKFQATLADDSDLAATAQGGGPADVTLTQGPVSGPVVTVRR